MKLYSRFPTGSTSWAGKDKRIAEISLTPINLLSPLADPQSTTFMWNTALKSPGRWIISRYQTFRHELPPYQEHCEEPPLSSSTFLDDLGCVLFVLLWWSSDKEDRPRVPYPAGWQRNQVLIALAIPTANQKSPIKSWWQPIPFLQK